MLSSPSIGSEVKPKSQPQPHSSISTIFVSKRGAMRSAGSSPKRSKNKHCLSEGSAETNATGIKPENMYSFISKKSNTAVIDLTDSPPGSPAKAPPATRRSSHSTGLANFPPHMGARRLVVKNFKAVPKASPEQYLNKVWAQLDTVLSKILEENSKAFSLEELYKVVENVCRHNQASVLFDRLSNKCETYIESTVKQELVAQSNSYLGAELIVLEVVCNAWVTWQQKLATVRGIFYFLDRSYLIHSAKDPSIDELATALFRDHIFKDPALEQRLLQDACSIIESLRRDINNSNTLLLSKAIDMFHALSVYTSVFEPKLLGSSQKFFLHWAQKEASAGNLAKYVDACHRMMDGEVRRCDIFKLDASTKRNLINKMDDLLIVEQEESLLCTERVLELMDHNRFTALRQLFSLLQRKGLGERIRPLFEKYINTQGPMIVLDVGREDEMVVRLLRFKKKLDNMWEASFMKHEGLGHSLREAFESFINRSEKSSSTWGTSNSKPGEMIAKYVDAILRGGVKALATAEDPKDEDLLESCAKDIAEQGNGGELDEDDVDEEVRIDQQLDQVLDLFRFVHGKAVFEAFYKRDLARRLLMERSASANAEKSMLTRLKSECGSGFTHNLEQMFKDIELAREEMASYKSMLTERQKRPSIDLNVNVLSASSWPTYPDVTVQMPRDIQKASTDFEVHYQQKHTGRKLAWKHALACAQLKANFPKGNKVLIVSGFQAIVLLLFNNLANQPISYSDMAAHTRINDVELKRTLQELACARLRVLTKSPKGKEVNPTDTFVVHTNFEFPKLRVKINTIQLKETKEENKDTHERVAADRHFETQAAIVRIMKREKTITHVLLVSEVIKATKNRGVLDAADIKRNIERLIEKEYMERTDGAKNSYSYLA